MPGLIACSLVVVTSSGKLPFLDWLRRSKSGQPRARAQFPVAYRMEYAYNSLYNPAEIIRDFRSIYKNFAIS